MESSRVACRRFAPRTLCSLFLATTLWLGAASAHSERVSGVVLSVLPDRREVVVRRDVFGAKPALTTLFRLSPKLDSTSLHAGDHIVAEIAQRNGALLLDDVRVVASAPGSVLRAARLLQVGEHMPATRFVDQFGHGFDFAAFRGKSVVLAFIYTRCADPRECPLISSNFHTLQKRLANGSYHLVELTLDPTYDRPPVLARYGALFGADAKRWTLGTGDPGSVL
ncbi:MAG TPA: SCO family protein, partial [Candidatus Baltobacteraceae bacterium]|nr:SCO family protein [Candidatus Baltobacteraceae bacterium]